MKASVIIFLLSCLALGAADQAGVSYDPDTGVVGQTNLDIIVRSAGTIYVRTGGNDTNAQPGLMAKPFLTLSNAFRRVTNNNTVVDIGPGAFRFHGCENWGNTNFAGFDAPIRNLSNVVVRGSGPSTLLYSINMGGLFFIQDSLNVVLSGFELRGVRTNTGLVEIDGLQSAITQAGTNGFIEYRNLTLRNWQDHGIGMDSGGVAGTTNTIVDSCRFINIGYTNLDYVAGAGGSPVPDGAAIANPGAFQSVRNCYFENCFRVWELQGPTGPHGMNGGQFVGNTLRNCYGAAVMILPDGGGNDWTNRSDILISGNQSYASNTLSTACFVECRGGQRITVTGNNIHYRDGTALGIALDAYITADLRDCIVSGNIIQGGATAIVIGDSSLTDGVTENIKVFDNSTDRTAYYGLQISGLNIEAHRNTFVDFGLADGLQPAIRLLTYEGNICSNVFLSRNIMRNSATNTSGLNGINIMAGAFGVYVDGNVFQHLSGAGLAGQAPTATLSANITLP